MILTSTAFSDGQAIPRHFTCDGENVSPPMQWADAPKETKGFALLCEDPDAPRGVFRHWAAYDIPGDRKELAEGAGGPQAAADFRHAVNDFEELGYGGPCPPRGHGTHHYHFRLLALDCAELPIRRRPTCKEAEIEARKHLLAEAILMGTYRR